MNVTYSGELVKFIPLFSKKNIYTPFVSSTVKYVESFCSKLGPDLHHSKTPTGDPFRYGYDRLYITSLPYDTNAYTLYQIITSWYSNPFEFEFWIWFMLSTVLNESEFSITHFDKGVCEFSPSQYLPRNRQAVWASYQIHKIAGHACAVNTGNFPQSPHGPLTRYTKSRVTHAPWIPGTFPSHRV